MKILNVLLIIIGVAVFGFFAYQTIMFNIAILKKLWLPLLLIIGFVTLVGIIGKIKGKNDEK